LWPLSLALPQQAVDRRRSLTAGIAAGLRDEIEARFDSVNKRIEDGSNKHIKVTGVGDKRRWTLIYPTDDEPVNSPFYSQLPGIDIEELLWFVAEKTGFLRSFTHVLERYVKQDAIAALPLFQEYNVEEHRHSSSDGQRIETQIPTINARYSSKYFGLKKGVSAYTLVLNHVPINATIIGTHEHESHYVYHLLHNNTTDIKPERHSTDTHGTNQVNFWLLRVFGYQFAPRYRDLHKKIDGLVGFKHPKHYADYLVKPGRKAYDDLICRSGRTYSGSWRRSRRRM
jgi:hypothetical protein